MKLVKITWVDAANSDGWVSIEKASESTLETVVSVGYLVAITPDIYVIAMDKSGTYVNNVGVIPKSLVKEVVELAPSQGLKTEGLQDIERRQDSRQALDYKTA